MTLFKFVVTAPEGRYIPGFGSRNCGESFEVDEDQAAQLREVPGLSLETAPAAVEEWFAPQIVLPESENGEEVDG